MPDIDQDERVLTDEQIERARVRYGWPLPPMRGGAPDEGDEGDDGGGDDATDDDGHESDEVARDEGDDGESTDDGDDEFDRERALSTIRRQRKSEAEKDRQIKELRAKVQEFEDAGKSDAERRDEKLASTEKENGSLKSENARLKVALDLRLTASQAKRLVGETEEELKADAEELLASFGGKKDEGGGKRSRPKENLKPGTVPDAEPEEMDPKKLAADLPSYA